MMYTDRPNSTAQRAASRLSLVLKIQHSTCFDPGPRDYVFDQEISHFSALQRNWFNLESQSYELYNPICKAQGTSLNTILCTLR